jgi:lipoprotein-releasing system permease protein
MYKSLLCWRYLKTRYLAMACIISVMLGVATLIVVNSVMSGFSTKLREKLHKVLSDVVIESVSFDGFADPVGKMELIRRDPYLGPRISGMTTSMEVFAMMQFDYPNGERATRLVRLIGIDEKTRGGISGFQEHLKYQKGNADISFDPPEYVRQHYEEQERRFQERIAREEKEWADPDQPPPPAPPQCEVKIPCGAFVGNLIATFRRKIAKEESGTGKEEVEEVEVIRQGAPIFLGMMSGSEKPGFVVDRFVCVDLFKSEMSEYDGNYLFVPLSYLQQIRGTPNRVTSIQIKLHDYRDAELVTKALEKLFPPPFMKVSTWEQKQGPLLEAIKIEKGILNVLLFLIIAVAGFGILAIFSMIVTEKTRDIGIMKALGASNLGVMNIFLGYGLLLGVVGAGFGTLLGICITDNLNPIADFLADIMGQKIFDPTVYYFDKIPTDLQISTVAVVDLGAVIMAVLCSVLPAARAARLQPVQALRYE